MIIPLIVILILALLFVPDLMEWVFILAFLGVLIAVPVGIIGVIGYYLIEATVVYFDL